MGCPNILIFHDRLAQKMVKQIERQIRELQKELMGIKREKNSRRLQPCRGDAEIRKKEEMLEELKRRTETLNQKIRELERKRRELLSEALRKDNHESPFT